jgi:hypothetical protein
MKVRKRCAGLTAMLIRSGDPVVHPSTRFAGTSAIEAEIDGDCVG